METVPNPKRTITVQMDPRLSATETVTKKDTNANCVQDSILNINQNHSSAQKPKSDHETMQHKSFNKGKELLEGAHNSPSSYSGDHWNHEVHEHHANTKKDQCANSEVDQNDSGVNTEPLPNPSLQKRDVCINSPSSVLSKVDKETNGNYPREATKVKQQEDKRKSSSLAVEEAQRKQSLTEEVQSKASVTETVQSTALVPDKVQSKASKTEQVQSKASVTEDVQSKASVTEKVQSKASVTEKVQSRASATETVHGSSPVIVEVQKIKSISSVTKEVKSMSTTEKVQSRSPATSKGSPTSAGEVQKAQNTPSTIDKVQYISTTKDKQSIASATEGVQGGSAETMNKVLSQKQWQTNHPNLTDCAVASLQQTASTSRRDPNKDTCILSDQAFITSLSQMSKPEPQDLNMKVQEMTFLKQFTTEASRPVLKPAQASLSTNSNEKLKAGATNLEANKIQFTLDQEKDICPKYENDANDTKCNHTVNINSTQLSATISKGHSLHAELTDEAVQTQGSASEENILKHCKLYCEASTMTTVKDYETLSIKQHQDVEVQAVATVSSRAIGTSPSLFAHTPSTSSLKMDETETLAVIYKMDKSEVPSFVSTDILRGTGTLCSQSVVTLSEGVLHPGSVMVHTDGAHQQEARFGTKPKEPPAYSSQKGYSPLQPVYQINIEACSQNKPLTEASCESQSSKVSTVFSENHDSKRKSFCEMQAKTSNQACQILSDSSTRSAQPAKPLTGKSLSQSKPSRQVAVSCTAGTSKNVAKTTSAPPSEGTKKKRPMVNQAPAKASSKLEPERDKKEMDKASKATKKNVHDVLWDEQGMTWEVYGASLDPESLGFAIQSHLQCKIKEHEKKIIAHTALRNSISDSPPGKKSNRRQSNVFRSMFQSVRRPNCCVRQPPSSVLE